MPIGFRRELSGVRHQELLIARERALLQDLELEVSHQLGDSIRDVDLNYGLAQTNFNRRVAAEKEVQAVKAAYEADRVTLDLLLDAQSRRAQAESDYYRALIDYNKSIMEVHYRKGSLLDYNGVYLAEGPWPGKAYFDALREARKRDAGLYLDYGYTRPNVLSRGPIQQGSCDCTPAARPTDRDRWKECPPSRPVPTACYPRRPTCLSRRRKRLRSLRPTRLVPTGPGTPACRVVQWQRRTIGEWQRCRRLQPDPLSSRPAMNIKRITRLLKLLQTLQSGSGQNADGLAKSCGVSRRTMFRDLDALRHSGVPIEFDVDNDRYSIPGAYFLPPVNFTAAEALSLMAMAIEFGRDGRLPFQEPAHAAVMKLEGSLPTGLREQLRDVTRAIEIRPAPISAISDKRDVYQQVGRCPRQTPGRANRVR